MATAFTRLATSVVAAASRTVATAWRWIARPAPADPAWEDGSPPTRYAQPRPLSFAQPTVHLNLNPHPRRQPDEPAGD